MTILLISTKCFQGGVTEEASLSPDRQLVRGMFRENGSRLSKGNRCQNNACRLRCDFLVTAASIQIRDKKARWYKKGSTSMKYVKVIVGLGLIPLGVLVGS